ncbi:4-aminobutyrate aminotransferase family protein [Desulfocapsa sulfexigens DSM 10523]|uniref:4-aminobutyrate aminotransferase family protein n=1 Tax=Desulfocapsa sulfexigens (strain DSM 10523 / SB164P1) TaxID=1167006 RepID=M1PNN3_DESSD|nr:aminotransferase class III-fold pyridoxal phosphate-dependent enzyme [Desulfocapsa sulfexigens]AGF78016.1 4-aminobutyrate aminotransferase family protein [Desulfocapsa sulfexigens DSM 10523]
MKNIGNYSIHELKIPNIVDSHGVYLIDESGKQYMDLESGIWCTALGHKNKQINDVIKNQIESVMHTGFCYSNRILEKAADTILSLTSFKNGEVTFLSSGSEAIELLRQITTHISKKKITLALHDAYLGSYRSVIDRDTDWHIFDWQYCESCPKNKKCSTECYKFTNLPNNISEFIFEPGSASGFVRFPPKSMVQNLANIVRKNKGKIIANEVTTGIGRTGKWFGFQHYGITPDMIAIGKGIGNGYPVSVAVLSPGSVKEVRKAKPFSYLQSHQNDPLGAAIANEVIRQIQSNNIIEHAEKNGRLFLSQLESLVDGEIVLEVRGKGLMFAVELVSKKVGDDIYNDLIEQGFIVCNRKALFRIDPPLVTTEKEFNKFVNTFKSIINAKKRTLDR